MDRDSAALGYTKEDHALINGSHLGICQFEHPSDPKFISLRNALATITRDLTQDGTEYFSPDSYCINTGLNFLSYMSSLKMIRSLFEGTRSRADKSSRMCRSR